ncbi:GNAT family N-acetyltransferase [Omnitrophica bacterium]|nr:GNAT family N-acetyltransferase [Candidatus Omnitrophota bacterium]
MKRLVRYLFQSFRGIFFDLDMGSDAPVEKMDLNGYAFREIKRDSFKSDPIFAEKNRQARFCSHFDKGHRCYGFFDSDDFIVSYLWISISDKEITVPWIFNMRLIVRPGVAYIWDCFTAVDYRRQGLYRKGLLNARPVCFNKGVKKAYIYCTRDNLYSKAGITSAGFKEAFSFFGIRIGPLCIIKKPGGRIKIAARGQTHDITA